MPSCIQLKGTTDEATSALFILFIQRIAPASTSSMPSRTQPRETMDEATGRLTTAM